MAKHENRTIKISGGTITGSNIAGGNITHGSPRTGPQPEEIRKQLKLYREEFVRAAGEQGDQVRRRLDRLDDELAEDKPDADAVRGGWKAVAKLLTGAGAAAESVKKIAELVHALFP
jgi:hypothetical protein